MLICRRPWGFTRTSCLSNNGGRWGRFRLVWRLEESTLAKAVRRISGGPGSDPKNKSRQSTLGRAAHPWGELLKPDIEASQATVAK